MVYQPGQFVWTDKDAGTRRVPHKSPEYEEIELRAWLFALSRNSGVSFADPRVKTSTHFCVKGFKDRNLAFDKQIGHHKFYSVASL